MNEKELLQLQTELTALRNIAEKGLETVGRAINALSTGQARKAKSRKQQVNMEAAFMQRALTGRKVKA